MLLLDAVLYSFIQVLLIQKSIEKYFNYVPIIIVYA